MLDRRDVLIGTGAAAGLAASSAFPRSRATPEELTALAERLRAASREDALDIAAAALAAGVDLGGGVDFRMLLGAVMLAGIDAVCPMPGVEYHPIIMVESMFELASDAPPRDALLLALWNLDDMKLSQQTDRRGPWRMPAAPRVRRATSRAAREELLTAMDAWDSERADAAIVRLLKTREMRDPRAVFELIRPLALRCGAFIGHKAIYAAQVERVLPRIGMEHAEYVLRSLTMVLLEGHDTTHWEESLEVADRLPAGWDQGADDPAQSETLLDAWRSTTPEEARAVLVDALVERRLGTKTIWDGLRLFASELFERRAARGAHGGRKALLPVHAVTLLEAYGHMWSMTRSANTRRALIVHAPAALAAMRDVLEDIVDLRTGGPGIDVLGADAEDSILDLTVVLERGDAGLARVRLDRTPSDAAAYIAHQRTRLIRAGIEHHQHKLAAAIRIEAARTDPRWRARLLAPSLDYLANPGDPDSPEFGRCDEALRRAGL